jgi:hypothetical protein
LPTEGTGIRLESLDLKPDQSVQRDAEIHRAATAIYQASGTGSFGPLFLNQVDDLSDRPAGGRDVFHHQNFLTFRDNEAAA